MGWRCWPSTTVKAMPWAVWAISTAIKRAGCCTPTVHTSSAQRGASVWRQRPALGIVHIHHGHAQAGPIEQLGLGLPVSVHAAVVVQVVLGEVGKDGSMNSSARKAMLNYSNR